MAWPTITSTQLASTLGTQVNCNLGTVAPGESAIVIITTVGIDQNYLTPTDVNLTGYTGGITATVLDASPGGYAALNGAYARIGFYRFDGYMGPQRVWIQVPTGEYAPDYTFVTAYRVANCGASVNSGDDTDVSSIDVGTFSGGGESITLVNAVTRLSAQLTATGLTAWTIYFHEADCDTLFGREVPTVGSYAGKISGTVSGDLIHGFGMEFILADAPPKSFFFGAGL